MLAIKARTNLFAWAIVGVLVAVMLFSINLHADDVLGVLQGLLIFGLLGISIMLRWAISLRFWSALLQWLRRMFGRGE